MRARGTLAAGAALLVAAALAGCTSSPVGARYTAPASESPVPAATSAPRPTATAPRTKQPPPTQDPSTATPVDLACSSLVPSSVVRAFRVGYRPVAHPVITAGTDAARIRRLGGTLCEWRDRSSGHIVRIGVARPGPKDLLALENDLVDRSNSVPTYGVEGYFRPARSGGISDAFPGPYWVHAASQDFYEPGDAITFIRAARDALAKTG